MKYEKAQDILPEDIIKLIQQYIDGGYLYIPRKFDNKKSWGSTTGLRKELKKRNVEIFEKHIRGISVKELTEQYYLTENSIRRIIRQQR
ncbi:CD3324 family protein [Anaerophilus nitritogenes]|uniref:CD3324 family protein n=1 Tax=Anaerophilus nitritogenes TaxID=2498136 RepID=UPI00101C059C|nr:CD3324 family protein [Anaerophilus nitritogenes]